MNERRARFRTISGGRTYSSMAHEAHRTGYTKLEITNPNDGKGDFLIELCQKLAFLDATLTMAWRITAREAGIKIREAGRIAARLSDAPFLNRLVIMPAPYSIA
ncbi:hypothetical protein AALA99_05555 [Anaerotruncus colihominis]|uniref:hypothetical protein n=1 Tax=Anaerotruncus colihominis TaxID=169435 RepID=UPI003518EC6D